MSDGEGDNGDVDMKPSDPNDLTAYNLDTYDEEESRGAGECVSVAESRHHAHSHSRS